VRGEKERKKELILPRREVPPEALPATRERKGREQTALAIGRRRARMKQKSALAVRVAALVVIGLAACTRYERQVVPFKMPSAYPNVTIVAGATIAAKAYDDPDEAANAFGFDIRGAGILPVQVIFDNTGDHPLEVVADKTLLVDTENNLWPILNQLMAYDRITKKTELGQVAPEAAKSGVLGGLAGAIIGAAIGIVGGSNVAEAAGKGAALGAATGATMGGIKGMTDSDVQRQIREDLQNRSLERRAVTPHEIAHGFIFFPGEAKKAKELRISIRETDTRMTYPLIMKF
jgi:hypothetical protein